MGNNGAASGNGIILFKHYVIPPLSPLYEYTFLVEKMFAWRWYQLLAVLEPTELIKANTGIRCVCERT